MAHCTSSSGKDRRWRKPPLPRAGADDPRPHASVGGSCLGCGCIQPLPRGERRGRAVSSGLAA
eukprot:4834781-Alexandrium_andersonii.AAC.1